MQRFEDQEFRRRGFADRNSAATYDGFEFRRCYFQGYFLSLASEPALRSIVRNARIIDCAQRGCTLYCPIVEDVLVDGFKTHGQLFQAFGAVFNRVELRGKIDRLMLTNDIFPSGRFSKVELEEKTRVFRAANAAYYQQVEWALDISAGEFRELDIRGVPARLIRRDPQTQIMVTRERVLQQDWRELPYVEGAAPFSLERMLHMGWPDRVLIAPKRHPRFRSYLADLELLRRAGVAEPD